MNQSKKSNVIMPPSGTFTVDFTYLYKVKFFDIYKLFVKLTVIRKISFNLVEAYFKDSGFCFTASVTIL